MNTMKKKLFSKFSSRTMSFPMAMLLGTAVLASSFLTGCSGSSGQTAPPAAGESETAEPKTGEEVKADTGSTDTLDVFINMSWYPIDSFTGAIPELIREKTGVDLNVTIATDSNQLGVMIGSGEIPDLVFTDVELDRLSNPNVCYSYTELEELYGASFAEAREDAKNICSSLSTDGNYYTLLNNYNTNEEWANLQLGAPGQSCILYRKDLLEKMGNPPINTMEDFLNVLEQCKTEYPDMVPFGLGGYWKFQVLENFMGVYSNQFNPETGEYYYEASAPGYKDFLKTANQMARNGYVTAEAYANENEADGHQLAYNNGSVFYTWFLSYNNFIQLQTETKKINPDAEWALLPKLGSSGQIGTGIGWAGAFVSKNCKNPEAAARLLTYLHSEEGRKASMWGREGIDFTMGENGVPEFSEDYKAARSDGSFNEKYNSLFYFGSTAIDELYMNYSGLDQNLLDVFSSYGKGYQNFPEVGVAKPVSSTDEGVIFTKMEELRKSYEAKVIFTSSDEAFESAYEEYMTALEKTGLTTYNDYMKQAILDAKTDLGLN